MPHYIRIPKPLAPKSVDVIGFVEEAASASSDPRFDSSSHLIVIQSGNGVTACDGLVNWMDAPDSHDAALRSETVHIQASGVGASTDAFPPVRTGRIVGIWEQRWATENREQGARQRNVLLAFSEEGGERWRDLPKNTRSTLVMVATLVVWLMKAGDSHLRATSGFLNLLPGQVNLAANPMQGAVPFSWILYAFIVIHHMRMLAGIEFSAFDPTFLTARDRVTAAERHRRKWIDSFLVAVIATASVLLSLTISFDSAVSFLALLWVHCVAIGLYLWVFNRELFTLDADRKYNRFLAFNDIVLVAAVTSLTLLAFDSGSHPHPVLVGISAAATVFYSIYFIPELCFQYARNIWRSLCAAIRPVKALWEELTFRIGREKQASG